MLLIAYSKLGYIFWLKFDETSHKLKQYIIVTKMAENVSVPAWQALEGDGGNLGAREI